MDSRIRNALSIVKGCCAASIVLSILALAAGTTLAIALFVWGEPNGSLIAAIAQSQPNVIAELASASLTIQQLTSVTGAAVAFSIALLAIAAVVIAIPLIAGIKGFRYAKRTEDEATVPSEIFGWAIAGVIVSFLSCRLITAVLFVTVAVQLDRIRSSARKHGVS